MNKEPKYYFIYYNCKSWSWSINASGNWISNGCNDSNHQYVTDQHPLQWQMDCNEKYGKEWKEYGSKKREDYQIISWQMLTVEEYNKFKDHIG